MKIGIVQYSPEWQLPQKNISKLSSLIEKNIADEDLLIFPEMTLTGFTMEAEKYSEEIEGNGINFFIQLATIYNRHIFAGIIENDSGKFYNSLYHISSSGKISANYRKIHPFSFAKEHKYYNAGITPVITKIENVEFGLSICYDLRFPELYRIYGKNGCPILVNIANWPVARIHHWSTLLKARAIENQAFMVGVNRVGSDPYNIYNGFSSAFDPTGAEIFSIPDKEGFFSIQLDIDKIKEVRSALPFLKDIKLI